MPILTIEKISKDFRHRPLFSDVTFSIDHNERIGLIGTNGSGKTTLMNIAAAQEQPDSGIVHIAEGCRVGYLPQNPDFNPSDTVLEAIFSKSSDILQLIQDYELACSRLPSAPNDPVLERTITELAARIESAGAWDLETNAKIILSKLGITSLEAPMGSLSGGQRKRVALAHALIVRPDLLMLDEPTNHLDAETISWLEGYLEQYRGALLLVTHDRYFLDRVTDHILEIDRGTTQLFNGSYSYYLERKSELEFNRQVEYQKQQALIKRELAWLKRGAKARTTKQKARIQRAEALMEAPREQEKETLDIHIIPRKLGSKVIDLDTVSKSFDDKVLLNDFSYSFTKGERVGIIGRNGSGKTTLLELLTGSLLPDQGNIEIGPSVVFGYYDQESRMLNDELRVIDYIREIADHLPTSDGGSITSSQMLERFLFPPSMQFAPIAKLSGGERRRLYLLRLLMGNPNVLLLDEPTNDLDIPTLVALETFLDEFEGTLIVVSHDRYFLDRTIDHLFRFEDGGTLKEYPGNYSAFLEIKEREEKEKSPATAPPKKKIEATAAEPAKKKKLTFKEQKEYEGLETEIARLEAKKQQLETDLATLTSEFMEIERLSNELQQTSELLDERVNRWIELSELV